MEECKHMGLKVLGPDINESEKGFAVNKKGEIRFGFSGLKGVGEAALENIIEERNKRGPFTSIYDFIKRVTQRTVNKKSLESLAYAGAFDCFKNIHRAQYFFIAAGESVTALEKIIRFGNQYQAQVNSSSNTLFGDLQMAEVVPPKLFECEPWPLIKLLDYEKEVTGMFLSGHPLDNFKFELKHFNLTSIAEFNEFKETVDLQPNPGRIFRIAGLVSEAQHRIAKSGNKYGVFHIEDFTSKMELNLFTDDYVKYHNYLEPGTAIFMTGNLRQRFNKTEYEFKVSGISLLE
jgi:DNA polymerase-3 subunit alpha